MSGILAVLARDGGGVDPSVLESATDRLAPWGPHASGTVRDGPAALGHRLLWATPEAGRVDHPVARGDVVVTADARLDNRGELTSALDAAPDVADAELIATAYERWGEDCPDRLLGAFAFAVWDRTRERLFCARDHTGLKPLYAVTGPSTAAVASAAPPLLALPGVSDAPDDHRVGDYLAGLFADRRRSFFDSIERIPPGHARTITAEGVDERCYWSLADVDPLPSAPRERYERRFGELFEAAVSDRLRCHEPVGSLLSGGVDSSSIVCVGGRLRAARGEAPLHTFSAVFDEIPACDEREYVQAVRDAVQTVPHDVHGDRIGPLGDLDELLDVRGEPYYPSLFTLIPTLYGTASEAGVRAVLHGYGGDQTMGSDVRGYLRGLVRRGQLRTFAREVRAYRRRYPWLRWRGVLGRDVLRPLVPEPLRRLRHAAFDDERYVANALASIDPAFARRSGLVDRLAEDAVASPPRSQRALRREALTTDEPPFNLELNAAAGAAAGVEPRYPYLDKRLVAFAVALPPGTTVRNGLDRTIVRNGLADDLPTAVRERDDKTEFSPNVVHGVETYELDRIEAALFDGAPAAGTYLDVDALADRFDRFRSGEGTVTDARDLLMATTLERWLAGRS